MDGRRPKTPRELADYLAVPRLVAVSGLGRTGRRAAWFVALADGGGPGPVRLRPLDGSPACRLEMPAKWAPGPGVRRTAQEARGVKEGLAFDGRGFVALGVAVRFLDEEDPFR